MSRTTTSLQARAMLALPPALQETVRQHRYGGAIETAEFTQELWISLLSAGWRTPFSAIAKRAQSRARRFTEDIAHYAAGITSTAEAEAAVQSWADMVRSGTPRGEATAAIREHEGCSARTARRRVQRQRERAKQGDLFGSGTAGAAA